MGSYFAQGTSSVAISGASPMAIPGVTIIFTPTVNVNTLVTVTALPLPQTTGSNVQGSIDLMLNGVKISSQYYSAWDGQNLVRLWNYCSTTKIVQLNAGTNYTFSVQVKSWIGTTLFNRYSTAAPVYLGADPSDANSMKILITIILFII